MNKINSIKAMATCIFSEEKSTITTQEFDTLMKIAESQDEKELYVNLYNFFLKKNSKEVIKNGKY